jgi:hypothetical protein
MSEVSSMPKKKSLINHTPSRLSVMVQAAYANPQRALFYATVTALGGAIVFNATINQTNRHPAPLFVVQETTIKKSALKTKDNASPDNIAPIEEKSIKVVATPPERPESDLKVSPSAQTLIHSSTRSESEMTALVATVLPPVRVTSQPQTPPSLIQKVAVTQDQSFAPSQRVLAAQKALNRLGYGPIKADGVMGVTTRQALELFEKDRKMPVTGDVLGATRRVLASQSGLPID